MKIKCTVLLVIVCVLCNHVCAVPVNAEYGVVLLHNNFDDIQIGAFTGSMNIVSFAGSNAMSVTTNGTVTAGSVAWSNYSVTCDLTLSGRVYGDLAFPVLMFRRKDASNYYALYFNGIGSSLDLYRMVNGSIAWLAGTMMYLGDGRTLGMRIDVFGDTISVYVKSISYPNFEYPVIIAKDNAISSGGIGFVKDESASSLIVDNVMVRELISPPVIPQGTAAERLAKQRLCVPFENPAQLFEDIRGHWAQGYIRRLAGDGILRGYFTNRFYPDMPIKTSEFVTIVVRGLLIPVIDTTESWFAGYMNAAVSEGIVDPVSDPSLLLDRKEAALILYRAANSPVLDGSFYPGCENLDEPYRSAISFLCSIGVMSGFNGDLEINGVLTRAEASALFARFLHEEYRLMPGSVAVGFSEYERAFPNPYKGFRGSANMGEVVGAKDPLVTLVHQNIRWKDIEKSATDTAATIISYCNNLWKDCPKNNIKVIPRVILEFPPYTFWPNDMTTGDYTSSNFLVRLSKLIEKLGEAWDNDNRVAFVQMGIIGSWGEMQSPYPSIAVQRILADKFSEHFRNKKVLVNFLAQVGYLNSFDFGSYWDSFAHWGNIGALDIFASRPFDSRWETQPMGGEAAFDWGETLGQNPDDGVRNYADRYIDVINFTHFTYLGWLSGYNKNDPSLTENAERIHKTLGYRFVINQAQFTSETKKGGDLNVSFTVANTASAPIYYKLPLRLSLLNELTKKPVWSQDFSGVDITTWLPCPDYSREIEYTVTERFTIPSNFPNGTYIIALSIPDPDGGNTPSVRFANENYFSGGYHPLGRVVVGGKNTRPLLSGEDYDDIVSDKLSYVH